MWMWMCVCVCVCVFVLVDVATDCLMMKGEREKKDED